MQKFSGYRIKGKNIGPIETVLVRARDCLHEAATEEYHRLLSEEIAELVDDIAMNVRQRPDCPLLDVAANLLNQRVMDAESSNAGTEYDLRAGVQLIPDGDGYTYCILSAANPILEQAFAETSGVEDYTTPLEADIVKGIEMSPQSVKWQELDKRYNGESPLISATLTTQIQLDKSRIRTLNKSDRAAVRARRHLTTLLLNRYAGGKNIPNEQLMRILDCALLRMSAESESIELEHITQELMKILPDYTIEDILRDPRESIDVGEENVE